tara:strand:- start:331 stop:555 length:225 start_codon:yes stop_codon:yes gene_type:complete
MASIFGIAKKGLGLLGKKKKIDLKKIHDKYFDKSGMKQKGKNIVKEGLKGLRKKPIGTFSTFPSEIVRTLKGKK